MSADIGLIGLAVMGENLVLNMANHGFTVAVYNRTTEKVDEFVQGRGKTPKIIGCHTVQDLCAHLKKPRRVMIMVRAGDAVDAVIKSLTSHLEKDDIIIDGGNSNYLDSNRRAKSLADRGLHFVGSGVSGGEEGALTGPSIMPGGSRHAWENLKDIFQTISAKVEEDGKTSPCCDYVGEEGSGHYVKMVHNGIEYGDMQLISEAYFIMKTLLGLDNEQMAKTFDEWNKGELNSYLIEITAEILRKKDDETGQYIVDLIYDSAGQKGTGKWTVESALNLGVPVTLIGEAVFARVLSSQKNERVTASKILHGSQKEFNKENVESVLNDIKDAIYASKIVSYTQGYNLMLQAAKEYNWNLNFGGIALMWRGGCIIRSKFLGKIKEAFDNNPNLTNLLFDNFFRDKIHQSQAGWRRIASYSFLHGVPIPAISAALSYYDGIRTERLPANLLQAQRDYFGAHTYKRIDKPLNQDFHTNWTGRGGTTSSSSYNV
jgi:6-phosphogluconate dehydrogenase